MEPFFSFEEAEIEIQGEKRRHRQKFRKEAWADRVGRKTGKKKQKNKTFRFTNVFSDASSSLSMHHTELAGSGTIHSFEEALRETRGNVATPTYMPEGGMGRGKNEKRGNFFPGHYSLF